MSSPAASIILALPLEEGGGIRVLRAEPAIDDLELLVRELRFWLTDEQLSADESDRGPESGVWSAFDWRTWYCVARVGRQASADGVVGAYAHLRLWPLADVGPGFDPGLLLGRFELFPVTGPLTDASPATLEWPDEPTLAVLTRRRAVAASLLGCLLQAHSDGQVLVVAVPATEMAAHSDLARLILFARSALPVAWKAALRLRLFTLAPALFIRRERAGLLVIPERLARVALSADAPVLIADADGQPRFGQQLRPEILAYANALAEQVIALPAGLLPYTDRCMGDADQEALDWTQHTRQLSLCYRLAEGLRRNDPQHLEGLFRVLVFGSALAEPPIPWTRLVSADEWGRFPAPALFDFVLLEPADLNRGARELQRTLEQVLSGQGLTYDAPPSPATQRRLLDLAIHRPPLIAPALRRELIASADLETLLETASPEDLIRSGALAMVLSDHPKASAALLQHARSEGWLALLLQALASGHIASATLAEEFLVDAAGQELVALAAACAERPAGASAWRPWFPSLVARLRAVAAPLAPEATEAGRGLLEVVNPASMTDGFLQLLALVGKAGGDPVPALERYAHALASADADHRRVLVQALLASDSGTEAVRVLVDGQGHLRIPTEPETLALLLADEGVAAALSVGALLRIAPRASSHLARVIELLDRRLLAVPDDTVGQLIEAGLWEFWASNTRLDGPARRCAALAWLRSAVWGLETAPQPTLEAWRWVMAALRGPGLQEDELPHLRPAGRIAGACGWPRIRCFEPEQVADLAGVCADLGAAARLVELLEDAGLPFEFGDLADFIASRLGLPGTTGAMLRALSPGMTTSRAPLSLSESGRLLPAAGQRQERAFAAYRRALLAVLTRDPVAALAAAAELPSAARSAWYCEVRHWLIVRRAQLAGEPSILDALERANLPPVPAESFVARRAAVHYAELGLARVAAFLDLDFEENLAAEGAVAALLPTLAMNGAQQPDWAAVATLLHRPHDGVGVRVRRRRPPSHPLRVLAARCDEQRVAPPTDPLALLQSLFAAAATAPILLTPDRAEPGDCQPLDIAAVHLAMALLPGASAGWIGMLFMTSAPAELRRDQAWLEGLRGGLANGIAQKPGRARERVAVADALMRRVQIGYHPFPLINPSSSNPGVAVGSPNEPGSHRTAVVRGSSTDA